jgi:hypothetical protein
MIKTVPFPGGCTKNGIHLCVNFKKIRGKFLARRDLPKKRHLPAKDPGVPARGSISQPFFMHTS